MAFDPEAGGSQSHVLTRSTFSKPVSFGGADCHGGPPPGVTRPARALGDAVEMPRAARSFSLVEWPPAHNRIVPRGARYQDEGHCSARAHRDGRCTVSTSSLIP